MTARGAFAIAAIGVIVVLGAATWAWIHVPELYPPLAASGDQAVAATREATRSQAIVTTRASLLAALAGLGALVTIAINYRNSAIANRNARTAVDTLATTNETLRISARGLLNDRYTKAIEQLGDDSSPAVRLGGIYALQQFAVETDRTEDQTTVVEVLSAFVRTKLPRRSSANVFQASSAVSPADASNPLDTPRLTGRPEPVEPPPDVLAAISALAQLPDRIELRADFTGVDFTGIDISRTRLAGAVLRGADLRGVYLRGAVLRAANLGGAVLRNADLNGANLRHVHLGGADLSGALLNGSDLRSATLRNADLRGTRLRGAVLRDADLTGASLRDAVLRGALLRDAVLSSAVLSGADLRHVDFSGADLSRADFHGAELSHAYIHPGGLHGASLTPQQLTPEQRASMLDLPPGPVDLPTSLGGHEHS